MFIGLVTSWNGLSWAFLSLPDDSCQCVHWIYAFCHTMHLFTLPSWTWVRHIYHLVTQYFPGLCEIKNESWWDVTISVLFCLLASIFAYIQLDNQTYLSLLMPVGVIDGRGKRWRPPLRWSGWALSHCAMTAAAAIPDPHHHIIDTKPTANLPLARCLWHGLRWSCLDYNPAA